MTTTASRITQYTSRSDDLEIVVELTRCYDYAVFHHAPARIDAAREQSARASCAYHDKWSKHDLYSL